MVAELVMPTHDDGCANNLATYGSSTCGRTSIDPTEDEGANVLYAEDVRQHGGRLQVDPVCLLLAKFVTGSVANTLTDDIQEQILPGEINHPLNIE